MQVLVTGASGLIGSHLCERLLAEGYTVCGTINTNLSSILNNLAVRYTGRLTVRTCDIRDREAVNQVIDLENPAVIFHLAARLPHHQGYFKDFDRINSVGTYNLLRAVFAIPKPIQFIYASTMSVYMLPPVSVPVDESACTKPSNDYGRTKLDGERLVDWFSSHIPCTTLRFASVYGVGDTTRVASLFMKAALKDEPLLLDEPMTQSSDFIHVDDAVEGLMLARKAGLPGVFNIGSGVETTIKQLAYHIIRVTGSKSEVKRSGRTADRSFRFVADISKAKVALGYRPTPLEEGLGKYAEELRNGQG